MEKKKKKKKESPTQAREMKKTQANNKSRFSLWLRSTLNSLHLFVQPLLICCDNKLKSDLN